MASTLANGNLDPPIVQVCYQICLDIQKLTAQFPKRQKFILGEAMAKASLEILTGVAGACAAGDTEDKALKMREVLSLLLPFRLKLRLARDLGCLGSGQFVNLSVTLDDIQRQAKSIIAWAEAASSGTGGGESRRWHINQNSTSRS